MNRRQFWISSFAFASLTTLHRIASAGPRSRQAHDEYKIWSLLISKLVIRPTEGILVLNETAAPDGPPVLPEIEDTAAHTSRVHEALRYQTPVPIERLGAFHQALESLDRDATPEWIVERYLSLSLPYDLLSGEQTHEYLALNPAAVPAGWKPDPDLLQKYKGFNLLVEVSKPYYNKAHDFAMVWFRVIPSCSFSGWFFFRSNGLEWLVESWRSNEPTVCS